MPELKIEYFSWDFMQTVEDGSNFNKKRDFIKGFYQSFDKDGKRIVYQHFEIPVNEIKEEDRTTEKLDNIVLNTILNKLNK